MQHGFKKLQVLEFTQDGVVSVTPEGPPAWEWQVAIVTDAAAPLTVNIDYAMFSDSSKLVAWEGSPFTVAAGGSLGLVGYTIAPSISVEVAGLGAAETCTVEVIPSIQVEHGCVGQTTTTV